jgi:Ca2+-binding RTX toxin-like protein
MTIKLFDTPFFFFEAAFGGFSNYSFTVDSSSSTQIGISQPGGGPVTTIHGTGMVFDGTGPLIEAGTITGMDFSLGGSPLVSITGMSWAVADLNTALIDQAAGDYTAITALFAGQPFDVDGSGMTGFIDGFHLGFFISETVQNVTGGAQSDYIAGNANANVMWGGGGDDFVSGGAGNDRLNGGAGNDVLDGGTGRDVLNGGAGKDALSGGKGADRLFGAGGNDQLRGDGGNDRLLGGAGRDKLFGSGGNDTLSGGKGHDKLIGGHGNDAMTGGAQSDVFVFSGKGNDGSDHILDFQNGLDHIQIGGGTLIGDLTITGAGIDTVITIAGNATTITLDGVDSTLIDPGDFLFV